MDKKTRFCYHFQNVNAPSAKRCVCLVISLFNDWQFKVCLTVQRFLAFSRKYLHAERQFASTLKRVSKRRHFTSQNWMFMKEEAAENVKNTKHRAFKKVIDTLLLGLLCTLVCKTFRETQRQTSWPYWHGKEGEAVFMHHLLFAKASAFYTGSSCSFFCPVALKILASRKRAKFGFNDALKEWCIRVQTKLTENTWKAIYYCRLYCISISVKAEKHFIIITSHFLLLQFPLILQIVFHTERKKSFPRDAFYQLQTSIFSFLQLLKHSHGTRRTFSLRFLFMLNGK